MGFGLGVGQIKRALGKLIPRALREGCFFNEDDGTRTRNIRLDRPVL